jgi:hypothetical protein
MVSVRTFSVVVCLAALVASWSVGLAAQESTATVTTVAPIYLRPDATMTPLRTAAVNTTLKVLEETGEWIRVEFQDPQFGRRVGYVQARNVRVSRAEQVPMDLSIRPPAASARQPEQAPVAPAETPGASAAAKGQRFARGWIDVDFGVAISAKNDYTSTDIRTLFREPATFTVGYHLPAGAAFDFGGGFMFTPVFGLGVSFGGTAHQSPADLTIHIPHPTIANRYADDSTETDSDLQRVESHVNIVAMFASDPSARYRVRVFGGPTLFRMRQDVVDNIGFDQSFSLLGANIVDITTFDTTQIDFGDAIGWGFNVGADVSWFFTRVVGVGGFGRYNRGTITTMDPFTGDDAKYTVGGTQLGGGLRLRF